MTRLSPQEDVLIAGAGPVGLLLANLLGARGLPVRIIERSTTPPAHSMAIGITPPSLAILKRLDLDDAFVRRGVAIRTARVFESGIELGSVDFSRIAADHRFILSLPQSTTIRLLRENMLTLPTVQVDQGVEIVGVHPHPDQVRATVREVADGRQRERSARYLAGCDGHRSTVRRQVGIRATSFRYSSRFVMADVDDTAGPEAAAHVYFSPRGSAECFPLPDGRRRWITQVGNQPIPDDAIGPEVVRLVRERTGVDLSGLRIYSTSAFQPSRTRVSRYVEGRVALCGDAAHVMSPIGGQGMNTGFADAAHLEHALVAALRNPRAADQVFGHYHRVRARAFQVAADRAARGMWLGTRRGRVPAALRRTFIAQVLFRPPVRARLAPYFAMLTIPGSGPAHPEGVVDAHVV